ncbi:MAG: hypothetical protein WCR02_08105 [Sphaerochaetaceae bacterium]
MPRVSRLKDGYEDALKELGDLRKKQREQQVPMDKSGKTVEGNHPSDQAVTSQEMECLYQRVSKNLEVGDYPAIVSAQWPVLNVSVAELRHKLHFSHASNFVSFFHSVSISGKTFTYEDSRAPLFDFESAIGGAERDTGGANCEIYSAQA